MKNWNILIIASCLLILIGYSFPLFKTVGTLKNKQVVLTEKQEAKELKKEALKKARIELAQTKVNDNIPFNPEQENLLLDFVKILKKSGFAFDSFGFSLGKHPKLNTPQIQTTVQIKGLRNNIKTLLSYIEQNERFLGMDHLSFNTQNKKGMDLTNLSLSIFALYQE